MEKNKFNKEDFKVGYFFNFNRIIYVIVSVFEDDGETFYVAKKRHKLWRSVLC